MVVLLCPGVASPVSLGAAKWPEGDHRLCVERRDRGSDREEGEGAMEDSRGLASFRWARAWLGLECGPCVHTHVCKCELPILLCKCGQAQPPRASQRGLLSRLVD